MNLLFRTTLLLCTTFSLVLISSCGSDEFVNTDPEIEDQAFDIDENSAAGTLIGVVGGTDVDEPQELSYNIESGNAEGFFELMENGELLVAKDDVLDFESQTNFQLIVEVTDNHPDPGTDQAIISISINDIAEPTTDGLVAYYPFDGNAFDESENDFNGTVLGAELTSDRKGNPNSAYLFNSEADIIETSTDIDQELTNGSTFSVWINPSKLDAHQAFISNYSGLGTPGNCEGRIGFFLRVEDDNSVSMRYAIDGDDFIGVRSDADLIKANVWQHLTFTWSGALIDAEFKIFLDGSSQLLNPANQGFVSCATSLIESNDPVKFGYHQCASGTCHHFEGSMDEIRIYSRVLSLEEITILANE